MDELIATAKAFAEADFDGNGVNDTIGMAVSKTPWDQLFTLKGFFNAFDSYPEIWVDDGTGKLVYGSTLPGTKDALATLHQMYVDGLLDPEFAVKDDGKVAEATTSGKCGIMFGAQWNSIYPLQNSKNLEPEGQWQAFPIVTATDHKAKAQTDVGTTAWTVVRKDCEHPEAVVKMYNLFIDKCWGPNNENGVYRGVLTEDRYYKETNAVELETSIGTDKERMGDGERGGAVSWVVVGFCEYCPIVFSYMRYLSNISNESYIAELQGVSSLARDHP